MATDIEYPPEQTAASLISGILGDLQRLVEQQFALTRQQIEKELRLRTAAAAVFAFGASMLFFAAAALTLAIVHGLHWMTAPPGTDPAWLPLWACYAVVAMVLAIPGGILVNVGQRRFRSVVPCRNPAVEILEEQVPWTTPST